MKYILLSLLYLVTVLSTKCQTGIPVPQMVKSDTLIQQFLTKYDIPGATVALAKRGKIVYMRAFGYSDINRTIPTQPFNLFRIASLSKQITSVTIMKLMEEGKLTMRSTVFGPGGLLGDDSSISKATISDQRIYDITVQHLLEHAAGWNRDLDCNPDPTVPYPYFIGGCDPISFPLRVGMLTGTANPVTRQAFIQYILEKGLDFTPGTSSNYSNMGYLVLGEIIEHLTGQPYERYVKDSILAPLGIYDMHIGKNLLSEKQEREVEYAGEGNVTLSCYGDGSYVPWEYGGFNVTAMDAHGGWIATGRDMLKLLTAVDGFPSKPDILKPSTITLMTTPSVADPNYAKGWQVNSSHNWWHTGALEGTASEQVRTNGGYTWIIIMNKRNEVLPDFWTDLDQLGWNCIAATSSWPSWDLMTSPTQNASDIQIDPLTPHSLKIHWTNGNGEKRLVLGRQDAPVNNFPLDGNDYNGNSTFGTIELNKGSGNFILYNGTEDSMTVTGLVPGQTYSFRVTEFNKDSVSGNNALYLLGNNPIATVTIPEELPEGITSFQAIKFSEKKTKLDWETQRELQSDHFEIQRSDDGNTYFSIGTLPAQGNSESKKSYSFFDELPLASIEHYQIKEVNKNGDLFFSDIDTLHFTFEDNNFKVITYAKENYITIIKKGKADFQNGEVIIRDMSGKALFRQDLITANTQQIILPILSKGIYIASIYTGKGTYSQKILIH